MNSLKRLKHQDLLCWFIIIVAIVLSFISIFTPPVGEIDNSVLMWLAQALAFVGACIGIDSRYKSKLEKRDND